MGVYNMHYMEFFKSIEENRFADIYLFYGEEEYVKEEALSQLVDALLDSQFKDLNYQTIDGSEAGVDEIINACETLPFMAERRLVIVKDNMFLTNKRQGGNNYGDIESEKKLSEYIENIPSTTNLIFYMRDGIGSRGILYRKLEKIGCVVNFCKLKDKEVRQWITKELAAHGKTITRAALDEFVGLAGTNLDDIDNEISKLVAFAHDEDVITQEHVLNTIIPALEHSIFQLVEAIGNKHIDSALKILDEMLDRGETFYSILPMIGRQIRLIYLCKSYSQRRYSKSQIAATLKIHPYGVEKYISQGQNFSEEELEKAFSDCLKLDHSIKQGKIDGKLGLEMLILSMCVMQKSFL